MRDQRLRWWAEESNRTGKSYAEALGLLMRGSCTTSYTEDLKERNALFCHQYLENLQRRPIRYRPR